MTDPRQAFLAEARERGADPAAVAALERLPAHLILTAVAIAEFDDFRGVLNAVYELLFLEVARHKRRAAAATAERKAAEAALRRTRSPLHLVSAPPAEVAHTTNRSVIA